MDKDKFIKYGLLAILLALSLDWIQGKNITLIDFLACYLFVACYSFLIKLAMTGGE